MGFPGNSAGKETACNARDPHLIPGSGRSTWEGIGYLLHYSWSSLVAQAHKEYAHNVRDLGLIPGLGRYPGEGNEYPLQYSGLENPMDYTVHGVAKSCIRLSDFHCHFLSWPWNTKWSRPKSVREENTLVIANILFQHKDDSTHGRHQIINTEIRLITFFATEDGEALYSHQKQDVELTVAHIMNSLLQNSDLNWIK